ncbi:MAG: flagellar biosynthetic protein FliO [Calditrichaeota bacterium]|nr:MAG: flagellar biosynthetic protein FliO [Calditrichota bacterium]
MKKLIRTGVWLFFALLLIVGAIVLAGFEKSAPVAAQSAVSAPTFEGGSMLQFLLAIFLVLGILLVLAFVARKYMQPGMRSSGNRLIEILDSAYVSPKSRILIVRIGERVLVLGATEQHLNVLTELNEPRALEELISKRGADGQSAFAQMLHRLTH